MIYNVLSAFLAFLAVTSAAPAKPAAHVLGKHSTSFLAAHKPNVKARVADLMTANPAALEVECAECVAGEETEIELLKKQVAADEVVVDLQAQLEKAEEKAGVLKTDVEKAQEAKKIACAKVKASGEKEAVLPVSVCNQEDSCAGCTHSPDGEKIEYPGDCVFLTDLGACYIGGKPNNDKCVVMEAAAKTNKIGKMVKNKIEKMVKNKVKKCSEEDACEGCLDTDPNDRCVTAEGYGKCIKEAAGTDCSE